MPRRTQPELHGPLTRPAWHEPQDVVRWRPKEIRNYHDSFTRRSGTLRPKRGANGRFASADDAIAEAIGLLRQKKQETQFQRKPLTPDELNQQLLEAGLLSQIPPRPDPAAYQEFSPIVIQGEPLSETIIRERR